MRYNILGLLFVLSNLAGFSQGNSPFSQFGPGDFYSSNFQSNFSRGGIGASSISNNILNPTNPSSYSQLTLATGETGIYSSTDFISNESSSSYFTIANLSSFGLGLPLGNGMGIAFGLVPYSKQNYDYSFKDTLIDNTPTEYNYSGDGGLSKIFIGYGLKLKSLSFGFNGHYIFGRLNSINKVKYPTDNLLVFNSLRIKNFSNVNGFGFNTGMQYCIKYSNENYINAGVSFELGKRYSTSNYEMGNYFNEQTHALNPDLGLVEIHNTENIIDTRDNPIEGQIILPSQIQFGISTGKFQKWETSIEVRHNDFSTYQLNNEISSLKDKNTIIFGGRIVPNSKALGKSNYWKTITYNIGGLFGNSGYHINNNESKEFGINFALGLPMKKFKYQTETFGSSIYLGFGYLNRSNKSEDFYENFLNINASIILNDKWFIKRKFQ
ncbi:MAG: hypothetical protein CMD18_03620 [Flavobacteriales bacterium]|nr:hypothetical protein [Flavobacteriales bacterium]|tara:strand:- start:3165 stop:4478 length:1314 start_codon:yes stop_codon:yes gene_type:complete